MLSTGDARMKVPGWMMAGALAVAMGGCELYENGPLYRTASKAVQADPSFPKDGRILPQSEAEIYPNKNASQVRIAYEYGAGGATKRGRYAVWLKKMGDRWDIDRVETVTNAAASAAP